MTSAKDRNVFDHVKDRWINPLYREGIGRRTGRRLQVNARRDSEGFENFSDYWSDSAVDSDISDVVKENETSRIVTESRIKNAEATNRKLSSPLKPMQSFSSAKSSEPSSAIHSSTNSVSVEAQTGLSEEPSRLTTEENTQQAEPLENVTELNHIAEPGSGHVDRTVNGEDKTPVCVQESLNEADVTGSIISLRTSQAPNSALQVFKTKKRLSFSSNEAEAKRISKNKEDYEGKKRQSPRGKGNTSKPMADLTSETQPQDADKSKNKQGSKSGTMKEPVRQSQRQKRKSHNKSSEEDEENHLDHTLTAASSDTTTDGNGLSFSSIEAEAKRTSKNKEGYEGKKRQSPRGKGNTSKPMADLTSETQPQDVDKGKNKQGSKSGKMKEPVRQSQRQKRKSHNKSSEEDEENHLDHTVTAASLDTTDGKGSTDTVDNEELHSTRNNKGSTEDKDSHDKQVEIGRGKDKQTDGQEDDNNENHPKKAKTTSKQVKLGIPTKEHLKETFDDSVEGSTFLALQKSQSQTLPSGSSENDDDESDIEIVEEPEVVAKGKTRKTRKETGKGTSKMGKGANKKDKKGKDTNDKISHQVEDAKLKSSEELGQESEEEHLKTNLKRGGKTRNFKQSTAASKTLKNRHDTRDKEVVNHLEDDERGVTKKSYPKKSVISQGKNGENKKEEKQQLAEKPLRKSRRRNGKESEDELEESKVRQSGNKMNEPEHHKQTTGRSKRGKASKTSQRRVSKRNNRQQEEGDDHDIDQNLDGKEEEGEMIEPAGKSTESKKRGKRSAQVVSKGRDMDMLKSSEEEDVETLANLEDFCEDNIENLGLNLHHNPCAPSEYATKRTEAELAEIDASRKRVGRSKGRKSAPAKVFELVQLVEKMQSESTPPVSVSFHEKVDTRAQNCTSTPSKWKAIVLSPASGRGKKRGPKFTVRDNASKTKVSSSESDTTEAVTVKKKLKANLGDKISESRSGETNGLCEAVFDFDDNMSDVSDGDSTNSSNTFSSISLEPVASKRLSWQKSPSELSPITIDPNLLDNSKNDVPKSKANQKTTKRVQGKSKQGRKRKVNIEVAIEEVGNASMEETQSEPSKQKKRKGSPKKRSQKADKKKTGSEFVRDQSNSMQADMLESDTSQKSTSSPDEETDRRASCVMKMGVRGSTVVTVHAQDIDDQKTSPFTSTDPTPTPRSILRKSGKKTHNGQNNKRLTLHFFEKPKKKGYLVQPEKVSGLRRSRRTRVQTLEYWRNERPQYERRKSGGLALVGVMSPITKTPAPRKTLSKTKRQKRALLDCQTPSNVSLHVSPPPKAVQVANKAVPVMNPETDQEVEVDAIVTNKMHRYVGPSGKVAEPEDPITVCKCLHQQAFSSGILKVRAFKEKGTQLVRRNTMVFYIVRGKIAVTIHNTTHILQTDDTFFVPQGNVYNIRNLRKDEAKLKFFQLKNC